MRGEILYNSKILGECASDIDLASISDDVIIRFIKWAKVLEDVTTNLIYCNQYYQELIKTLIIYPLLFEKYNTIFTNILYDLSIVLTIETGKLFSTDNDLCLYKFNVFCTTNQIKLFGSKNYNSNLINNLHIIAKQKKLYDEKISKPRKKFYAHIDEFIFTENDVNKLVDNVSFMEFYRFAESAKHVLSNIWAAYNGHKMCFELENSDDYIKIIDILKAHLE